MRRLRRLLRMSSAEREPCPVPSRRAPTVPPLVHVGDGFGRAQPASLEQGEHPLAHHFLARDNLGLSDRRHLVEAKFVALDTDGVTIAALGV